VLEKSFDARHMDGTIFPIGVQFDADARDPAACPPPPPLSLLLLSALQSPPCSSAAARCISHIIIDITGGGGGGGGALQGAGSKQDVVGSSGRVSSSAIISAVITPLTESSGAITIDEQGNIQSCNCFVSRIFGRAARRCSSNNLLFKILKPCPRRCWPRRVADYLSSGRPCCLIRYTTEALTQMNVSALMPRPCVPACPAISRRARCRGIGAARLAGLS